MSERLGAIALWEQLTEWSIVKRLPRQGTESRHGLDTNHPPSVDIFKKAKEKPCHGRGGWRESFMGGY